MKKTFLSKAFRVVVFRKDNYRIEDGKVLQEAEIPLRTFPGGINTNLLRKVRENPEMSVDDFILLVLGGSEFCNRIGKKFGRYAKRANITPEMLCLVDPREWERVGIRFFGDILAGVLLQGIRNYRGE